MTLSCAVEHALAQLPIACPEAETWTVAYSGGLDSSVLLHAAHKQAQACGREVRAVHVNHGLQPAAADFERHCVTACAAWDIPLTIERGPATAISQGNVEAQARQRRYEALRAYTQARTAVLMAHHQDDQAETLLLQLFRGSGTSGTAGMPVRREWGEGQLVRPFLNVSRRDIEQYAQKHEVPYIEDPSNADTRLERNFLRREAWPLLRQRWPELSTTLARAARHQAHAARLLRERAEEDLGPAREVPVARLTPLSEDRQINALRFWIMREGYAPPSEKRLRNWLHIVHSAAEDRLPQDRFEDYEIRRWRGCLYLTPRQPEVSSDRRWLWRRGETLELPELGMTLDWPALQAQVSERVETDVEVRLRRGGERCQQSGRPRRRALKKLLQEAGVPPWNRNRIPLIYQREQLRLVWRHFECVAPPAVPLLRGQAEQ